MNTNTAIILMRGLGYITCIGGAVALIMTGHEHGWGWLIFAALVM